MKNTFLTLAITLGLGASAIAADGTSLSYNNIGAGYGYSNLDEIGFDDASSAFAEIQLSPFNHLFFYGGASVGTAETTLDIDIDFANFRLGIGSWVTLDPADRIHLVLEAGAVFLNFDVDSGFDEFDDFSDDEFGGQVRLGIRAAVTRRIEAQVFLEDTFTNEENVFGVSAGVVVGLTNFLAITANAGFVEDETSLRAGLRFNW